MEYLLYFCFVVLVIIVVSVNLLKGKEKALEKEYKNNFHIPPTAMVVKYIRGIPEIDAEIEKRYSHIINNAYAKFHADRYRSFVEDLERNNYYHFDDTVRKIKNKINDPRFTKNLCSVDNDTLIYMFEEIGIIDFYFWVNDNKFYLADKHHQGIGTFEFSLNNITCFCTKEDIEQERDVDKSIDVEGLDEFMVGTVLRDGTITFNKSIFPQTVVEFIFKERVHCGYFSAESYEVFKNQISEKELNFILNNIESKPIGSIIVDMKELKIESEEIMDKISKLMDLKEYGLFTDSEFEEKKEILMKKIEH
jgi:hypothetical protein